MFETVREIGDVTRDGVVIDRVILRGRLGSDGRLEGSIQSVDWIGTPGPAVKQALMPVRAGVAADLEMQLRDGRVATFMVQDSDGTIANGRVKNDHQRT